MSITHSSRSIGAALSLATAVLLGACAQTPSQPESHPTDSDPPPLSGSATPSPGAPVVPVPVALQPNPPQSYTVVPGDTLWSIAQRFLKNPWQWREIWRQNPQVRNPNRIYPGDVLKFSYDASGKPQLEVAEREETPLIKLSPQVRVETINQPIPPVPRDAVESFLTRALVLNEGQWKKSPYIVADDDNQIIYADRDRVYVLGGNFDQPRYQVFRPGEALIEPGSGRNLGTAGIYMGEALLDKDGDPATFTLVNTIAPVRAGDRLFEIEAERELYSFEPHPVPPDTDGFIIAQLNPDVTQITQYSSVIINLGAQEGLEPGHVLAIYGRSRTIDNPISGGSVKLPGERSGLLMVYKVHDLVSYALVMQAERAIRLQDQVTTP
ncbi:LysM peptidoglycan-binding domain-containing protein [Candidatus Contendibacter odensensis]|uniref:Peptidoglycan-binding lysin domain protein n=1 Tax=Candidatus Contendobacter odensis Run_B_J11 TaxID=1400861 RepID=A0A7U7J5J7_9GAMM|nr:LysM domain-containing protein [Candidatus Contendobacter odensis]MBK8753355.1 LysM peptidoglycan-binding domain-containing protein [Candidatus Competibacteraceae bacterium]CDH46538.1 putative Peptidoglycan-binding lysin domain protein [Candidatus Contendobacter odensis Run_B_J11]